MASSIESKLSAYNDIALLVGRILIGVLFLMAAYAKFKGLTGTTGYFTKLGVPAPSVAAPLVAAFELAVGVFILVGFKTRFVALAIAAFRRGRRAARAHELRRAEPAQPLPEESRHRRRMPRAVRQRSGCLSRSTRRCGGDARHRPFAAAQGFPYQRRPQEGRRDVSRFPPYRLSLWPFWPPRSRRRSPRARPTIRT